MDALSSSRLALAGAPHLTDEELVAIVLGPPIDLALAQELLRQRGGIVGLERVGFDELRRAPRVGQRRAERLKAALELGRRALDLPLERGNSIRCADDVEARLRARLIALEQEELHVLGLDSLNRLVVHAVIAVGAVNRVFVSPRDVYRPLIKEAAASAIVVHNHPSGSPAPSDADAELTRRLARAGALVGIELLDHIVIARAGRYSFAEQHRLLAVG